jgi:hypothetical protein
MPDFGGGGSSKQQKSTVTNDPWSAQQPHLKNLFSRAEGLYNSGPIQYYGGDTRANMSPVTQGALQGITERGQNGSPLNQAAGGYITDTLSGKYLNADAPGLDSVLNRARSAADSTYAGLGRYGSGAHDTAVADSVGNLMFQNYQAERDRMGGAAALAPQIAGQDFIDLNAVLGAGDRYQGELQGEIDADIDRYNFQQQSPYANLQSFQDFISGGYGGNQQSLTPKQQGASTGQQALGGGLALASLFAQMYGNS